MRCTLYPVFEAAFGRIQGLDHGSITHLLCRCSSTASGVGEILVIYDLHLADHLTCTAGVKVIVIRNRHILVDALHKADDAALIIAGGRQLSAKHIVSHAACTVGPAVFADRLTAKNATHALAAVHSSRNQAVLDRGNRGIRRRSSVVAGAKDAAGPFPTGVHRTIELAILNDTRPHRLAF